MLDNYFEAVISGLCPPIIIFILSYLLMKTVRGTIQRRIVPVNAEPNTTTQNPTFLPYAIQLIY